MVLIILKVFFEPMSAVYLSAFVGVVFDLLQQFFPRYRSFTLLGKFVLDIFAIITNGLFY